MNTKIDVSEQVKEFVEHLDAMIKIGESLPTGYLGYVNGKPIAGIILKSLVKVKDLSG